MLGGGGPSWIPNLPTFGLGWFGFMFGDFWSHGCFGLLVLLWFVVLEFACLVCLCIVVLFVLL